MPASLKGIACHAIRFLMYFQYENNCLKKSEAVSFIDKAVFCALHKRKCLRFRFPYLIICANSII
jgi:hypothetical protein